MRKAFEQAKKAVESLFWDTCWVETFQEEQTDWGETLHQKGEADSFPCRLTEKAEACGERGLLAEMGKTVILLYPTEKDIPAGSRVRVQKENGEERQYLAAGDSRCFLTHKAVGLKRRETI